MMWNGPVIHFNILKYNYYFIVCTLTFKVGDATVAKGSPIQVCGAIIGIEKEHILIVSFIFIF